MIRARIEKPRSEARKRDTIVHEDSRTQRERQRGQANAAALKAEMDDILDEIDAVLEENTEEFVRGYVQRGGE